MATKATREYPAKRKYVLRRDATVANGQREIESVFGLPQGSVHLMRPTGRRARGDKTVNALLADWGVG